MLTILMKLSDIGLMMFACEVKAKNCSETPQKMTLSSGGEDNKMFKILNVFLRVGNSPRFSIRKIFQINTELV